MKKGEFVVLEGKKEAEQYMKNKHMHTEELVFIASDDGKTTGILKDRMGLFHKKRIIR